MAWAPAHAHLTTLLLLVCSSLATVPVDLSNFNNNYVCDASTLIVRPQTVQDVQKAVARYSRVRSNGMGHSWNKPFFCANASVSGGKKPTGPAVNIQLSTFRPFNIQVLEDELAVWVDAGVRTIDLINFLGDYVTAKAPAGYTLGAFPAYVYQTIAGAVSTNTHGSSLTHSSLSNQVAALDLVLANGTLVTLSPETHPFLMRAARVSVGRLGVITRVKFRIVKEQPVKRELRQMKVSGFLNLLKTTQQTDRKTGVMPAELYEAMWAWHPQRSEIYMTTFAPLSKSAAAGKIAEVRSTLSKWTPDATTIYSTSREWLQKASRLEDLPIKSGVTYTSTGVTQTAAQSLKKLSTALNTPLPPFPRAGNLTAKAGTDRTQAVTWPLPVPRPPNANFGSKTLSYSANLDANVLLIYGYFSNGTAEDHKAYVRTPDVMEPLFKGIAYDQCEVSFPLGNMYDCLSGLMKVVYGEDIDSLKPGALNKDKGFRSMPVIRMIGQEDGLLSHAVDGPRMYINVEDYLYYNDGGKVNKELKKVMGYLRSSPACGSAGLTGAGGRLHWGKAGWPDAGCWRGDVEYPGTWCDFGCAVKTLDPTDKFVGSAPDRWNWNGVDLDRCCGPKGFDKSKAGCVCKVNHARSVKSCPPPPYYTNR